MENIINSNIRSEKGKGANRKLRAQGFIPGVLYGAGEPPVSLSIPIKNLQQAMKRVKTTPIIHVKYDDSEVDAILKDIQYDPITENLLHVDLQRIATGQELILSVPVEVVGASQGVKQGGILQFITRSIKIKCLPKDIPEKIEVNISALDIGDSIELKDLDIPAELEVLDSLDQPVVLVAAPTMIAAEVPSEEAAEAGEEGEEASGKTEGAEKHKDSKPSKSAEPSKEE